MNFLRWGQRDTLTLARKNYLSAASAEGSHPPFGTRWDHFRREMAQAIQRFASPKEAVAYGQLKCGFDHRGPVTDADIPMMKTAQHLLRYEYPKFRDAVPLFEETRITTLGSAIEFESNYARRCFASNILYFHASYVLTIATRVPDVESICEVGGGYGNPALLWFTNPVRRVTRYAIVDLPESLFFAEVFLRTALPDTPLRYASEKNPATAAPGIALVPIHLAGQTSAVPFDAIVNTGSMAEMTDEWVAHWGAWLDRQNSPAFFSHNYFGNPVDRPHESRAIFAPVVGPDWSPSYVRPMHPMMLLHSDERMAAEIIFKRRMKPIDPAALLAFLDTGTLSLESYIRAAYAINRDLERYRDLVPAFAAKATNDLGYTPIELLHLLRDTESPLRSELLARYQSSRPVGAFSI